MLTAIVGSEGIIKLARSRAPADRQRLMFTLVKLCDRDHGARPEVQALLQDIFMDLVAEADAEARQRLATTLAASRSAPRGLILALAHDDIEIALPVIAASPVLDDGDLAALLREATVEHGIAVARRPNLGGRVVRAILDQGRPDVLAALAGNDTADLSDEDMLRLVGFSRRLAALRAPLARHRLLTRPLAQALHGWVGPVLRALLAERFAIEPGAFERAVRDTRRSTASAEAPSPPAPTERMAMERRVVEKLRTADQLRPGLLLRALHEGKLALFITALAALSGLAEDEVRAAVDAAQDGPLGCALQQAGVDRSAVPTAMTLVRALNGGRPAAEPSSRSPRVL